MSDDTDDQDRDQPKASGRAARSSGIRRDGRPYAEGNTGEDGGYVVGKGRPPAHGRFKKDDGRRRGRRPKGQRNFDKDWEDELGRTVKLTRDGREIRVSAHKAQVMMAMALAAKGKERSQDLVFRKAAELADRKRSVQSATDDALIAEWLSQQANMGSMDDPVIVGDDGQGVGDDQTAMDQADDPE